MIRGGAYWGGRDEESHLFSRSNRCRLHCRFGDTGGNTLKGIFGYAVKSDLPLTLYEAETSRQVLNKMLVAHEVSNDVFDMPVALTAPEGCSLTVPHREGAWSCEFVSVDGRQRAMILDFHIYRLVAAERKRVQMADKIELDQEFQTLIKGIEMDRGDAAPDGEYEDRRSDFLGTDAVPGGFLTCLRRQDAMVLAGAKERADREHLHCWGINPETFNVHQMLLSVVEYNDVGTEPAQSFTPNAAEIFASVHLK